MSDAHEPYCLTCGAPESKHPFRHPFRPSHARPSYKAVLAARDAAVAERDKLREALAWAYGGDGLDECALTIQRMTNPFNRPTKPDHSVQIGVRKIIDAMRKRAALKGEGEG